MKTKGIPLNTTKEGILQDYRVAFESRQASLIGRKEVFSGKAKFGIFGDGKEVAQLAMARVFREGDVRSGYYRDQTFMFALGMSTLDEFFAQLYAHPEIEADPSSAGRSMNAHFATRFLNDDGSWKDLSKLHNSSADVSPTGSQMPRLVGLGHASVLYRELPDLPHADKFSRQGTEIAFGTIGNASCAEGLFWESVNAIGVLGAQVLLSIWDDHYGISVPNEHQITKSDISGLLKGFQREPGDVQGFDIHRVKGWDYPALCETYCGAAETVRNEHFPAIVHVTEMTQPLGHSTSGSHERYKDKERLAWEDEFDCIRKMREWIAERGFATNEEMDHLEAEAKQAVFDARARAWESYTGPILEERERFIGTLEELGRGTGRTDGLNAIRDRLMRQPAPLRRDLMRAIQDALVVVRNDDHPARERVKQMYDEINDACRERYSSHLYSASDQAALRIAEVSPIYDDDSSTLRGFELLNRNFDLILERHPEVIAFGEDLGKLGDVNQGFAGLQEKYGELRVADTGIREATLIGQAIGMAMRGLRPIVEIQYLDYLAYALQIVSDDLATLQYRTRGGQKAPVVIRTRGHRLEGIWHSGSPMSGIINLIRGVYVCVPRDMTRAAGFYNTMLCSDDSALIVEVLNGYRLKEPVPSNLEEFTVPLGVPEVLREGGDITLVTYGACCRIALEAAEQLAEVGVEAEVIDVQTLLPFDIRHLIVESLKKTGRIVFVDEDVPGGTTAFMMQQVLDEQGGYCRLDSPPRTVSARPHRPAYGSDGDYWSKPNREEIFRTVYTLMLEADPAHYPPLF